MSAVGRDFQTRQFDGQLDFFPSLQAAFESYQSKKSQPSRQQVFKISYATDRSQHRWVVYDKHDISDEIEEVVRLAIKEKFPNFPNNPQIVWVDTYFDYTDRMKVKLAVQSVLTEPEFEVFTSQFSS